VITELRGIEGVPTPTGPFSQAVVADPGRILFIAGQVSLDDDGRLLEAGDAGKQAERCLVYIDRVLQAAGAVREDVAKVTIFLVDITDRAAVAEARARFFAEHRPAATLVEVSALAVPGLLVEIEAIAVLGGAAG
jgi:2-iminobutanoate/2-iminopropanoate deaminase